MTFQITAAEKELILKRRVQSATVKGINNKIEKLKARMADTKKKHNEKMAAMRDKMKLFREELKVAKTNEKAKLKAKKGKKGKK